MRNWAIAAIVGLGLLLASGAQAQSGDIILHAGDRIVWQIEGKERFIIVANDQGNERDVGTMHIQEWGRVGCDNDTCWKLEQEIVMTSEIADYPGEEWGAYYWAYGHFYPLYLPVVVK